MEFDLKNQQLLVDDVREENAMYCVIEYGTNTGILKNFFQDLSQAVQFVKKIITYSGSRYISVEPNMWHCKTKGEYLKIEEV